MSPIEKFIIDNLMVIKDLLKSKNQKEVWKWSKLDCSYITFSQYMRKHTDCLKDKELRRKFNAFYFDLIDSEEKAYFLGYIVADTCLYKPNNVLIFNSAEQDKQVFDNFIKAIEFQKTYVTYLEKTKNHQKIIRMEFQSEHLLESLYKLGIPYTKSKSEFGIPLIEEQYYNSFITGYFDGDGCIYNWKNRNFELCFTESQDKILKEIKEYLLKMYNIKGTIRHRKTYYQLRFSGRKTCLTFFNKVYNKDFALLRKYNKFLDIIPC